MTKREYPHYRANRKHWTLEVPTAPSREDGVRLTALLGDQGQARNRIVRGAAEAEVARGHSASGRNFPRQPPTRDYILSCFGLRREDEGWVAALGARRREEGISPPSDAESVDSGSEEGAF